nr:MAG TPA: hypothetical protein [Caudoviricetes sp.]
MRPTPPRCYDENLNPNTRLKIYGRITPHEH